MNYIKNSLTGYTTHNMSPLQVNYLQGAFALTTNYTNYTNWYTLFQHRIRPNYSYL